MEELDKGIGMEIVDFRIVSKNLIGGTSFSVMPVNSVDPVKKVIFNRQNL